jgi:hypothetical protein
MMTITYMRLHQTLDELLSTPTCLRLLRILVRSPERAWTGRELAQAARASPPQTLNALKQFEHLGVVWRVTAGRAHLWRLVSEHVLVKPVRSLLSFEEELPERFLRELRSAVGPLPVRRATLFGSMARGTETSDSDADLYLELSDSGSEEAVQTALTPIVVRFIHRFGVVLSPIVYPSGAPRDLTDRGLKSAIDREGIDLLNGVA